MRCTAPGPVVATQTPRRPVCLAKPQAMNAAASSWRVGMKAILSRRLRNASISGLIPSPTTPNTWLTPHCISVSMITSEVFGSPVKSGRGCGMMAAAVSEGVAAAARRGAVDSVAPAAARRHTCRRPTPCVALWTMLPDVEGCTPVGPAVILSARDILYRCPLSDIW